MADTILSAQGGPVVLAERTDGRPVVKMGENTGEAARQAKVATDAAATATAQAAAAAASAAGVSGAVYKSATLGYVNIVDTDVMGPATPSGNAGTAANGSVGGDNSIWWDLASVTTRKGVISRINWRVRDASPSVSHVVFLSLVSGTTYKVERVVPITLTGQTQYSTAVLQAGVHFDPVEVEAGWYIGYWRASGSTSQQPIIIAASGETIQYVNSISSVPTEDQTVTRTGTASNYQMQFNVESLEILNSAEFDGRRADGDDAKSEQAARLLAEKYEMTPLYKLARKIAAGGVGITLSLGTSIAASAYSTISRFEAALRREFGPARGYTANMGGRGGSWTGSHNGWLRQDYGGRQFIRLRGSSSSTAFSEVLYGDTLRFWYSTETDGGSFGITVDGVAHTINCSGSQSYGNVLELDLDNGPHAVTYGIPASGYAYLEWREAFDSESPGVLCRNSTLGGSSLYNCRHRTDTSTTGNTAGAAIVGTNGLDAQIHDDVDLVIIQWHVNDSQIGGSWPTGDYQSDLTYLVSAYVALGIPVIVITELAGSYRMPTGSYLNNYIALKKAIQRQLQPGVWVIDWDEMWRADVYTSDMKHFCETLYPATYNSGDDTYTGDFIHPDPLGYRPLDDEFSLLTGVRVAYDNAGSVEDLRAFRRMPEDQARLTAVTVANATKWLMPKATGVRLMPSYETAWRETIYIDELALNLDASYVSSSIDGSGSSDDWGKYVAADMGGGVIGKIFSLPTGTYWCAAKLSGPVTLRLDSTKGKILYPGDVTDTQSGLLQRTHGVAASEPVWYVFRVTMSTQGNFELRFTKMYDWCRVSGTGTESPLVVR